MTISTPRFRAQQMACRRFENRMQQLILEINVGTERRHLDVLVELLDELVEQTGQTLQSAEYRTQLASAKRRVAAAGHKLRSIGNGEG